jgi:hypothetical protein
MESAHGSSSQGFKRSRFPPALDSRGEIDRHGGAKVTDAEFLLVLAALAGGLCTKHVSCNASRRKKRSIHKELG